MAAYDRNDLQQKKVFSLQTTGEMDGELTVRMHGNNVITALQTPQMLLRLAYIWGHKNHLYMCS